MWAVVYDGDRRTLLRENRWCPTEGRVVGREPVVCFASWDAASRFCWRYNLYFRGWRPVRLPLRDDEAPAVPSLASIAGRRGA